MASFDEVRQIQEREERRANAIVHEFLGKIEKLNKNGPETCEKIKRKLVRYKEGRYSKDNIKRDVNKLFKIKNKLEQTKLMEEFESILYYAPHYLPSYPKSSVNKTEEYGDITQNIEDFDSNVVQLSDSTQPVENQLPLQQSKKCVVIPGRLFQQIYLNQMANRDERANRDEQPSERDAESTEEDEQPSERDEQPSEQDAGSTERDERPSERDAESTERDAESTERYEQLSDLDAESIERDKQPIDREAESTEGDEQPSERNAESTEGDEQPSERNAEDAESSERDEQPSERDAESTEQDDELPQLDNHRLVEDESIAFASLPSFSRDPLLPRSSLARMVSTTIWTLLTMWIILYIWKSLARLVSLIK